jgi:hypothetical protein
MTIATVWRMSMARYAFPCVAAARDANNAYLYERTNEQEYGPRAPDGTHVLRRGTSQQAGQMVGAIVANRDDVPVTAYQVAASTSRQLLPDMVVRLLTRRSRAVENRRAAFTDWQKATDEMAATIVHARARERDRVLSRGRNLSRDNGFDL